MNKLLRFTMVAVLAIVANLSFAQTTVTFVAGTDLGSISNYSDHGADSMTKDGITISITDGCLGLAANYRIYKGRFY